MNARLIARAAANPVAALAVAIALVGGTGVATAATGGTFVLGRGNSATTRTGLTNTEGTPLSLAAKTGHPPLMVNNSVKVSRLNADLLDGIDSAALQRRVSGTCADGAISAVAASGTVTCAALPKKAMGAYAPGTSVVGTFGPVTVNVSCQIVDEYEGPRLFMFGYFTGAAGTLVNGHATTTLYSDVDSIDPVGFEAPATASTGKLPTIDAPDLTFSRQTAVVMVTNGASLTQITLHLMVDARGLHTKPCTVLATAV